MTAVTTKLKESHLTFLKNSGLGIFAILLLAFSACSSSSTSTTSDEQDSTVTDTATSAPEDTTSSVDQDAATGDAGPSETDDAPTTGDDLGGTDTGDGPSVDTTIETDDVPVLDTSETIELPDSFETIEDVQQDNDAVAQGDTDAQEGSDVSAAGDDAPSLEDAESTLDEDVIDTDVAGPQTDTQTLDDDVQTLDDDVTEQTDTASPEGDSGGGEPGTTCTTACDCAQGQACGADATCGLESSLTFCCASEGCPDGSPCVNSQGADGICGADQSPFSGVLVINEVLTDGAVDGDPNGDGDMPDAVGDEFVELVNAGDVALDIGGFTLVEADFSAIPRHTFADATSIAPGKALVIFGGGTAPDDDESASYVIATPNDPPGMTIGLALSNDADTLQLVDVDGKLVAVFSYGPQGALPAISDESQTRQPEITGSFVPHSSASGNASLYSPGTKADGSSF